ncbi:MAG: glutaminase A [Cyanobacteriota bacterium]
MPETRDHDAMERLRDLFCSMAEGGRVSGAALRSRFLSAGIQRDDFRLANTWRQLDGLGDSALDLEAFSRLVGPEVLMVSKVLKQQLVIPDWQEFCGDLQVIYDAVAADRSGANADYIPILRDADSERWGVALCSVDGQRMAIGDVDVYHSIQSVSKPLTYAYALQREGLTYTHRFVGTEPSGRPFNALDLLPDQRPFNPCVNAGAIMMSGLVASGFPDLEARVITGHLMDLWSELCGAIAPVRFSEETMLSERKTADNNFAIAYLLQGRCGLPRNVDLHKMLDVYFSCCSIEMTARMLSVAAATLANGGVCPINGRLVLSTDIVKKTLSVMQAAGMYDNAGTFTLEVGLPAKSGVGGSVMVVVPNLLGFATFSPRLDAYGNSVRGVSFCHQLVDRFTIHVYDNLSGGHTGGKRDPRIPRRQRQQRDLGNLRWGLQHGDLTAQQVRDLILLCMVDISLADGELEASELTMMVKIYTDLIGEPPAAGTLEALAQSRGTNSEGRDPFTRLIGKLSEHNSRIDDDARLIILQTAFRVACADGTLEDEELTKLQAIAQALGIGEGVLELEVHAFRAHPSSQLG